jgi:hypothetical protein
MNMKQEYKNGLMETKMREFEFICFLREILQSLYRNPHLR